MSIQNNAGRPRINRPELFSKYYAAWKNGELSAVNCMTLLCLSKSTFYRLVKSYEAEKAREQRKLELEEKEQDKKELLRHLKKLLNRRG